MYNRLKNLIPAQKAGKAVGIYSACSANPFVIEAVLKKGKDTGTPVLIESTANQCDQYGGYTGMTPADFKAFVLEIADKVGFDKSLLFLGGDHLGPLTFAHLPEEEAMKEAETLVRAYTAAGFDKIHLDTSMKVADDDENAPLSDETIARRGAFLAKACKEEVEKLEKEGDPVRPVYIVGSEVPVPGGIQGGAEGMAVTLPEAFQSTMETFKNEFEKNGLDDVWEDVIAIVVQPGVEEKDDGCTPYDRSLATALIEAGRKAPIIFEGHSTDYQTRTHLKELVEDGVGILKVGPGLTFAAREALFLLEDIEKELGVKDPSNFREVLDKAMLENPKYWQKHYQGTPEEQAYKRKYSFSDRSRYYMGVPEVEASIAKLMKNLEETGIPMALVSQYFPLQYARIQEGTLENNPKALVMDKVGDTVDNYLYATQQQELL